MVTAFKVFDTNKNDVLEASEFRKALPLMGEDVPEEQIERLFQEADEDGSGEIEFDEFKALLTAAEGAAS